MKEENQGTGVIFKNDEINENNKRRYNQNLREEWLKEIREKNEREELRKRKEKEEDLRIEEKYRREMEEEKERERHEKMKLNENLRDISSVNLQMMEENKKKRNMVENDINYNNNQQGELLAEEIPQNYEIMREQNNNNNIEENNMQMNEMEFDSNNPQELEENINMQIAKLRDDVNSQYIEMSNLFGKLKMDVIEATQLKNEAEKELQYIRKELAKNKMASLAYDAELNQVLEKHAPYNNLHINIKEVDPIGIYTNK